MLTQRRLKEILHYNPNTGHFTYLKAQSNRVKAGSNAGSKTKPTGSNITYLRIGVDGKSYRSHRLAWLYVNGDFPSGPIDHIDGNGENNRISNLRASNKMQNARNCHIYSHNKSGYNGVFWSGQSKRWVARIKINGNTKQLGSFDSPEEAANRRKEADKVYGFSLRHGCPLPE